MKRNTTARLLAVLLTCLLVLSFAGCRSENSASESDGRAVKTAQTAEKTSAEEDSVGAAEQQEPDQQKSSPKKTSDGNDASAKPSARTAEKTSSKPTAKTSAATTAKKAVPTKQTTKKPAAAPRRSLVADAYELTSEVQKMLVGTVEFGSGGITYQNPKDALVSVRVRSKRDPKGGVQLYLVVKNMTGRPIRLNGYSNFAIRDLLGNELLSSSISLNKPVVLEDQDEQLVAITLPKEWYDLDDLYQFTVEAGLFNSIIALDYDFL